MTRPVNEDVVDERRGLVRAVGVREFGGVDNLQVFELPEPVARAGWVVVDVAAATVNPTDLLFRSGAQAATLERDEGPYVAGMEFAGVVREVASGVSRVAVGDRVMGVVNPRRREGGAQAERITLPAASVARVPERTDLVAAATVPMNGLTALLALDALQLTSGSSLLVTGAAGAVGGYAVQLATTRGLRVVADASPRDHELVVDLGADVVVPRGDAMAAAVRAAYPEGVDGLVDGALLGEAATDLVRPGRSWASLRSSQVVEAPHLTRCLISVGDHVEDTVALESLASALDRGVLTARVAKTLPATSIAEAHRLLERGGLRGRVVLTFD